MHEYGFRNAPVNLSFRAIAVPLVCGNTVVLKSSELSPRSQAIAFELLKEAGLPAGVLNYISIDRSDAPARTAEMIAHKAVRRINFTGSDRFGKILATEAAKYLKQCVFELGGKAPAIVCEDADLEEAAKAIVFGGMMHSGQICMATERVLVHKSIATKFSDRLVSIASKLIPGDTANDSSARLSALFTESSAANVINQLTQAEQQGAKVLLGDLQRKGSLVGPHVVSNVTPDMSLFVHESFGPVLAITEFETDEEAIALANDSDYSLMASLWTQNLHKAMKLAPELRAGSVQVNGATIHIEPTFGNAGLGGATGYGRFNVDSFTDSRMIVFHPSTPGHYPLFNGLSI